jgi:hypothetical protein
LIFHVHHAIPRGWSWSNNLPSQSSLLPPKSICF